VHPGFSVIGSSPVVTLPCRTILSEFEILLPFEARRFFSINVDAEASFCQNGRIFFINLLRRAAS
jgi:hypothetical protein